MKKVLGILCAILMSFSSILGLVACGEPPHVCSYVQKVVSNDYLKQSATCEDKAVYYYSCTCGAKGTEVFEQGDALGHSFKNYVYNNDATCTENGTETATCAREGCTETKTREKDDTKLGHKFENYVFNDDATCSENGTETGTCTREGCTETKTREKEDSKLEHTYTFEIVTPALCDVQGVKKYTCSKCPHNYTENYDLEKKTAEQIHNQSIASVCEITTYDKNGEGLALGTGFVFSSDGQIITNYHVIEDAYSAKVSINNQTYDVTKVLAYDKTIDLAVLKIEATNLPILTRCLKSHAVGLEVFAIGSSKGLTNTFSKGIITTAERELDGVKYVQHDAAISSGNSGGPLINAYGEVVGVNTMTIKDSQNLNFAISVSEIDNLDFSLPTTLTELYNKEHGLSGGNGNNQQVDAFTTLKNYAVSKGTYDSSDMEYTVTLGYNYSKDYSTKYTRYLIYNVEDNEIQLEMYVEGDLDYLVMIFIDSIDGTYTWGYTDNYGYTTIGNIYGSTFSDNIILGYISTKAPSSIIMSVRKLASSAIDLMLIYMGIDLVSTGVSVYDLGFINY